MKDILSKIYARELNPCEKAIPESEEYKAARSQYNHCRETLSAQMEPTQQEVLERLADHVIAMESEATEFGFRLGVRLGAQLERVLHQELI